MQTFLPYADFARSAQVLDRRRLGNQRVECLQLLRGNWPHHPAAKMWQGHRLQLVEYGLTVCREWISRGYRDTCYDKMLQLAGTIPASENTKPAWFGRPDFHLAHQSNLLRKKPEHYSQYFPGVPDNLPYLWF